MQLLLNSYSRSLRITIVLCVIAFTSQMGHAQSVASSVSIKKAEHWGLHGMLVFGDKDSLYASHLPMFHAPHDRQVIFRFHLDDAKLDAQMRAKFEQSPALWTLEPQEFDLDRLQTHASNPLKQFEAQLYSGHFERKGKANFPKQIIIIDEILVFNALSASLSTSMDNEYYIIGKGQLRYLMKKINRRPDFDILLSMRGKVADQIQHTNAITSIHIKDQQIAKPSTSLLNVALRKQLGTNWRIGKTIYFETGDLK